MKQVYWIDDSFQQMLYIMQGAITKLWNLENTGEEGIASKIFIFGNAYEVADTNFLFSHMDEQEAKLKMKDLFLERCANIDGPDRNRPVYNARKELISDTVNYLYKKDEKEDEEAYNELKSIWMSGKLEGNEENEYQSASKKVRELIDRVEMMEQNLEKETEQKRVIGMDVMLLYGDRDRLLEGRRIISMDLYDQLKNKGYTCFMYSAEADDDDLMNKWRKVYENTYKNNKETVLIFKRSDFMLKGSLDIINIIKQMFD